MREKMAATGMSLGPAKEPTCVDVRIAKTPAKSDQRDQAFRHQLPNFEALTIPLNLWPLICPISQ